MIKLPKGWRELEEGETIQDNDWFIPNDDFESAIRCMSSVGEKYKTKGCQLNGSTGITQRPSKTGFKIGDVVRTKNHIGWSFLPMTVEKFWDSSTSVGARHSVNGLGGFRPEELMLESSVSDERRKALDYIESVYKSNFGKALDLYTLLWKASDGEIAHFLDTHVPKEFPRYFYYSQQKDVLKFTAPQKCEWLGSHEKINVWADIKATIKNRHPELTESEAYAKVGIEKEKTMKNNTKFAVILDSAKTLAAVKAMALAYGWKLVDHWTSGDVWRADYTNDTVVTFDSSKGVICWNMLSTAKAERFTIYNSLVEALTKEPYFTKPENAPKALMIGTHEVEFKDNGVQVGCTFVPKATILEIAAKFS